MKSHVEGTAEQDNSQHTPTPQRCLTFLGEHKLRNIYEIYPQILDLGIETKVDAIFAIRQKSAIVNSIFENMFFMFPVTLFGVFMAMGSQAKKPAI